MSYPSRRFWIWFTAVNICLRILVWPGVYYRVDGQLHHFQLGSGCGLWSCDK